MSIKNLFNSALVFAMLLVSSAAFAQGMQKRTPEERAQNQMNWMQNNLALTNDQNQKVYNILLKYATEADNAKATGQKGERKEIQADRDADMKGVLTGNQYQLYQAHEEQMREKMQQRRSGMQQQNGN